METARQVMGEQSKGAAEAALREHGGAVARVVMALLGDAAEAEQALERVAREAGARPKPSPDVGDKVWLMGLARAACATRLSKIPLRSKSLDSAPTTERLGGGLAAPARQSLASLKPTEREAVVLHVVGGLDADEVAVACNVEPSAAKARIAAGIEQLLAAASAEGGAR